MSARRQYILANLPEMLERLAAMEKCSGMVCTATGQIEVDGVVYDLVITRAEALPSTP